MKHLVNFGLLFFFATLFASGLMRFLQPFALTVTRVHICCGFSLALLICLHLVSQRKYFSSLLTSRRKQRRYQQHALLQIACAAALWAYVVAAAIWNLWPVPQLINSGYEAQNAQDIFRPHEQVAYMPVKSGLLLHRGSTGDTGLRIEFDWGRSFGSNVGDFDLHDGHTQVAIWAENEEGMVLETLYVSESCAASTEIDWGGQQVKRQDILPVWYARYREKLGKEPEVNVDGVSSATPVRDFSMDGHLKTDALPFAILVEVNAPNDYNAFFENNQASDPSVRSNLGIGQPSVVYEARIYPTDSRRYYLMELVGHSGGDTPAGELNYDLNTLSTAKELVDKVLIKVSWP